MDLNHRAPGSAPGAQRPFYICKLLILKKWSGRVDLPYDTRDLQIQKYLTSIGSNGVYYARRSSNVELALDLPSVKVKDAAFGTALHEFAESYFPQYLAYR